MANIRRTLCSHYRPSTSELWREIAMFTLRHLQSVGQTGFPQMNGRVFSSEHYLVNVDVAMNLSFCWICRWTQHCSIDRFHRLQSNTGV